MPASKARRENWPASAGRSPAACSASSTARTTAGPPCRCSSTQSSPAERVWAHSTAVEWSRLTTSSWRGGAGRPGHRLLPGAPTSEAVGPREAQHNGPVQEVAVGAQQRGQRSDTRRRQRAGRRQQAAQRAVSPRPRDADDGHCAAPRRRAQCEDGGVCGRGGSRSTASILPSAQRPCGTGRRRSRRQRRRRREWRRSCSGARGSLAGQSISCRSCGCRCQCQKAASCKVVECSPCQHPLQAPAGHGQPMVRAQGHRLACGVSSKRPQTQVAVPAWDSAQHPLNDSTGLRLESSRGQCCDKGPALRACDPTLASRALASSSALASLALKRPSNQQEMTGV